MTWARVAPGIPTPWEAMVRMMFVLGHHRLAVLSKPRTLLWVAAMQICGLIGLLDKVLVPFRKDITRVSMAMVMAMDQ
jgi:hypothetical protein